MLLLFVLGSFGVNRAVAQQAPFSFATAVSATAGSDVVVSIANGPAGPTDWVGLAKVGTPDTTYIAWKFVNYNPYAVPTTGLAAATLRFVAPSEPGQYEVRYYPNNGSVASRRAPFTVSASSGSFTRNLTGVKPTDPNLGPDNHLTASIEGSAAGPTDWVALAIAGSADSEWVTYQYVNQTGNTPNPTLSFVAPATPGNYEFRYYPNNGGTVLFRSATFAIGNSAPSFTFSPSDLPLSTEVRPGAPLSVGISNGPAGATDWVALSAVSSADPLYLAWKYVGGATNATLRFDAPTVPGRYEFRYFANDGGTVLYRTASFTVSSAAPMIQASPNTRQGSALTVSWNSLPLGGGQNYIGLVPANAADSFQDFPKTGPFTFRWTFVGTPSGAFHVSSPAPANGVYEFRYYRNGVFAYRSNPIVVSDSAPTISAPTSVAPGQMVTVAFTNGLGNSRDWIGLAAEDSPSNSYLSYQYVNRSVPTANGTLTFTAPTTPGRYVFRYYFSDSYNVEARSAVFTVS
jgi:hypothetical protein